MQINMFTEVLEKISPEDIAKKQQRIADVAHQLQYSVPPLRLLKDKSDETVWVSPVRDAVDVFIDAMVSRAYLRRKGEFYGESALNTLPFLTDPQSWNNRYKQIYV